MYHGFELTYNIQVLSLNIKIHGHLKRDESLKCQYEYLKKRVEIRDRNLEFRPKYKQNLASPGHEHRFIQQ